MATEPWRDEPRDNRDLAGNLTAEHILGRIRQTSEDSAGTMVMWRSTWMAGIDPRVCYPGDPAPHGRYGVSGRNPCSPRKRGPSASIKYALPTGPKAFVAKA